MQHVSVSDEYSSRRQQPWQIVEVVYVRTQQIKLESSTAVIALT
jgi:hypothetical protein